MKLYQIIIIAGAVALSLSGCQKKSASNFDVDYIVGNANLKVVHVSAYTTNYSTQLKINTVRVSNILAYNTPFPGGGLGTGGSNMPWYMSLHPGPTFINLNVPKVGTDVDSIPLTNKVVDLLANNYYTAYLSDTAANTQLVLVNENVSVPANTTSRFKFVNLMPNQSLDLYWGKTKVMSNIPYKGVSSEFTLPKGDTARWYIRTAGSTSPGYLFVYPTLAATSASAPMTVPNQRILTVFSRGYAGATANRAPGISLIYNDK